MVPQQNTKPLSDTEMVSKMAAVGPFEDSPHIAVAVSGGADSMALTLLASEWSRSVGGKVTALSVDHGLRPGSAAETEQVGSWLAARGIDHHPLTWTGPKPHSGIQAAARAARYDLLTGWCRREGVLHLLLAHHLEDQAETFLLRLNRGSGVDGLAAMAAVIEKPFIRLLRPLLGVPKMRLRAVLEAASQAWLEDPSNSNTAFERVRIRNSFPALTGAGLSPQRLAETASHMARARVALEASASCLLAQCCTLDPAGYARIDGAALFSASEEISLRALSRTLICVGGGDYPPGLQKLERLHGKMKAAFSEGSDTVERWKGATLGRCRVLGLKGGAGALEFLICREARWLPGPLPVGEGMELNWDNRFRLRLQARKDVSYQDTSLQPLGREGWRQLLDQAPEIRNRTLPAPVETTLPALVDGGGVISVPQLNYHRNDRGREAPGFASAVFHPRQTLSGTGFLVAE